MRQPGLAPRGQGDPGRARVPGHLADAEADVAAISRDLFGAGLGITALVPEELSLESFFFELTEGAEPAEAAA